MPSSTLRSLPDRRRAKVVGRRRHQGNHDSEPIVDQEIQAEPLGHRYLVPSATRVERRGFERDESTSGIIRITSRPASDAEDVRCRGEEQGARPEHELAAALDDEAGSLDGRTGISAGVTASAQPRLDRRIHNALDEGEAEAGGADVLVEPQLPARADDSEQL